MGVLEMQGSIIPNFLLFQSFALRLRDFVIDFTAKKIFILFLMEKRKDKN
jgi:hypothetical protein